MKKLFIVTFFLILSLSVFAQEQNEAKYRTTLDFGYFSSSYSHASKGGTYLSAGVGYKINKEFWLNLNIIKITASGKRFEDLPFFYNNKVSYENLMIVPNFSKEWQLTNKFYLNGILGGALFFEKSLITYGDYNSNGDLIGFSTENDADSLDLALLVGVDFKYELTQNIFLTFNLKSYIAMYLEPDSYMLGFGLEMKL